MLYFDSFINPAFIFPEKNFPIGRGLGIILGMENVVAHGVDMVDCQRLSASIERFGKKFLDRVYTPLEQEYCRSRKKSEIQSLAGRFAVKEAVLKVLGTGWRDGIAWTDIEVRNQPSGQPIAHLHNKCREIAEQQGIGEILISISHIQTHAIASAIGLARQGSE